MDRFAFIPNPHDVDFLAYEAIPEHGLKMKNPRLAEKGLAWMPPFRRGVITVRSSSTQKEVAGDMIYVPLIPNQILNLDGAFVLKKVIEAGKLAQRLGAKIIGLGAYIASVGRKGVLVAKSLDIPVTTGTSYTIAVVIDATLKAADDVKIELDKAKITIIGATGTIGSVSAQILANRVGFLTLVSRNVEKLKRLADFIKVSHNSATVEITDNIKDAINKSDIVLISTTTPGNLLSVKDLPPGSVVCDISVPHNVSPEDAKLREDVLVIDGGLVQCPTEVDLYYFDLPPNLLYACLSEVTILALEGMHQSYSIGGDVSLEKVLKISQLALKHGFRLAEFRSFGKQVSEEQIEKVREARKQK